ncbi:hypothetical protein PPERSA_11163 [Pseudocohnilembus persalinus]|uniref:Uncharacterized protein n=1 Tax=Pseudocohnilembus persalinus TaxID=266149 RepID=A0A0V0QZE9_PSEPJ|nr:hypothetical protein PPERSA_11163 [Pseudocohnilembus persalinus]|eukprot:KRX07614.1 hypothetical protein PPERSA_11163 [Pseudocohnilembus persalinus]
MVKQNDKIQNKNQDIKVSGPAFKNLEGLQSVQYLGSKNKLFTRKKSQNILQNRDNSSDSEDSKNLFKLHNVQIKQIIQQFNYKDIIENQNQKDLEDEVKNQAKREDIMTDLMYKLHHKQYPDPDYSKEMKVVVKNQIENKCLVDHRTDLQENPKRIQINKKVHKQFAEKLQKAVRLKNNKLKLVQEQWKQNQAKANCKFQQDDEKIKLPKLAKRIANTFKDVMDFAQQHQNSQFSEKLMYFKEGVQMFYDMNEEEMYQKQKIFDQKRKLYGHQFANKSEAAQFYLLKEFQMAQKRIQKDLNRKQKSLGLKENLQEESKFQRQKEEYLESIKEQDDLQKIQEKKLKVLKNMEKKQSLRKLEKYEKENNLNFQGDSSFSDSDEEIEVQQLYGNKEENQEDAYLSLLKYFKTKQNLPEGSMVLEKNQEMQKFLQAYYQDNCNLEKLQLEDEKQEDIKFNQFLRELEEYRGLNGINKKWEVITSQLRHYM